MLPEFPWVKKLLYIITVLDNCGMNNIELEMVARQRGQTGAHVEDNYFFY